MKEKLNAFTKTPEFCKLLGVVISLFMFIVGGVTLYNQLKVKSQCTEEVQAVVTDYLKGSVRTKRGGRKTTYAPVFSYTYGGQEFSESNHNYQSPKAFSQGQTVTIYVSPDEPSLVYAPADKSQYIVSIALFGFGIFSFVFLYIVMASSIKAEQEKNKEQDEYKEDEIY